MEPGAPHSPSLLGSLKRLGQTLVALAHTRLEILGTEIEEERIRFAQLALTAITVAFFLNTAILLAAAFLVVLFWDTHRLATLGVLAAVFLAAGIGLLLALRHRLKTRPKMFATTLAELAKDRERLAERRAEHRAEE